MLTKQGDWESIKEGRIVQKHGFLYDSKILQFWQYNMMYTRIAKDMPRHNSRTHRRIQSKPAKDALLPLEIAPGKWLLSLRIPLWNPDTDRRHVKASSCKQSSQEQVRMLIFLRNVSNDSILLLPDMWQGSSKNESDHWMSVHDWSAHYLFIFLEQILPGNRNLQRLETLVGSNPFTQIKIWFSFNIPMPWQKCVHHRVHLKPPTGTCACEPFFLAWFLEWACYSISSVWTEKSGRLQNQWTKKNKIRTSHPVFEKSTETEPDGWAAEEAKLLELQLEAKLKDPSPEPECRRFNVTLHHHSKPNRLDIKNIKEIAD